MIRILMFSFISFILSCSVFKQDNLNNDIIEFTSLYSCSSRGGSTLNFKSIKKDSTRVIKHSRSIGKDTVVYKTDATKWETLNSLIDFSQFKEEMKSVGGNNHAYDGCNKTFTIKTKDSTFLKYNSKINSEKLKQFYELYDKM